MGPAPSQLPPTHRSFAAVSQCCLCLVAPRAEQATLAEPAQLPGESQTSWGSFHHIPLAGGMAVEGDIGPMGSVGRVPAVEQSRGVDGRQLGAWDSLVQHPVMVMVLPCRAQANNPHPCFSRALSLGLFQPAGLRLYSVHVFSDNFICAP